MNYKQKNKLKKLALWAVGVAVFAWAVFVFPAGKAFVNKLALKVGWGTAEKPLIS